MGNSPSVDVDRAKELVSRLAGSVPIAHGDPFWHELLVVYPTPLTSVDSDVVHSVLLPICQSLVLHNHRTHHVQQLALQAISLCHESQQNALQLAAAAVALQAVQGTGASVSERSTRIAAANVLRVLGTALQVASLQPAVFAGLLEISNDLPFPPGLVAPGGHQLLRLLVRRALGLLVHLPAESLGTSYALALEAGQLLLVLMHGCGGSGTVAVMGEAVISAQQVVARLLALYTTRPPAPGGRVFPGRLADSSSAGSRSVLGWAAATAASMLSTLGLASQPASATPVSGSIRVASPLADLSVVLLLLLVHESGQQAQPNPYRWALEHAPATCPTAGTPVPGAVNMPELVIALAAALSTSASPMAATAVKADAQTLSVKGANTSGPEEAVLLLYTLLKSNAAFKEQVTRMCDPSVLLLPLLRALHTATAAAAQCPRMWYLLQIVLLIMSEDAIWAASLHTCQLPQGSIAWHKDARLMGSVAKGSPGLSLGSLLFIVALQAVSSFWRTGSGLLAPTNALAMLANAAPYTSGLDTHAASRLINLLAAIAKRHRQLEHKLAAASTQALPLAVALSGGPAPPDGVEEATSQLVVVEAYLRQVLEIIGCCLSNPDVAEGRLGHPAAQNLALVYSLMQQQEVLAGLFDHPRLPTQPLQHLVDFLNARLDAALHQQSGSFSTAQSTLPVSAAPVGSPGAPGSGRRWARPEEVMGVMSVALEEAPWPSSQLQPSAVRYVYHTDPGSQQFFVSYTWALTLQHARGVCWDRSQMSL